MTEPAMITLDDGGYKTKIWHRKGLPKDRKYGSIALHCPVGHILHQDDIRILKPPKGYPPLVNGRNIFKVLEHETLHHVMADILPDMNDDTLDQLLEQLPNYNPVRARLLFGY